MKRAIAYRRPASMGLCLTAATLLLLAGCENGTGGVGVGTGAGALGGAALANVLGGGTAAMLGGAALGGLAGNMALDRPAEQRRAAEREASRDREMQRRLEFALVSNLQAEQVRRDIEQQRLFEQWKRLRGY